MIRVNPGSKRYSRTLKRLQELEFPVLASLIDHEFVAFCEREGEGNENITLEEVLGATSKIPGSLAEFLIDEERADRF